MGYVENNLGKNERVICSAKVHWISLIPHVVLMFIMIGFITIIPAIIRLITTELVITNKKISGKVGLINTKSMDSPLNKIQNAKVEQGLFGKILGYGDIIITTASGVYSYKAISSPDNFKNTLNQQIDIFDEERIEKQAQKIASGITGAMSSN